MMLTALLIQVLVFIIIVGLFYRFLIPLLPPPFGQIAQIVLAIFVIIWLINLLTGSIYSPLGYRGL